MGGHMSWVGHGILTIFCRQQQNFANWHTVFICTPCSKKRKPLDVW